MAAAAVLYVKDLDAMCAFYQRCFDMSRVDDHPDEFCVLTSGDWELTLVAMSEAARAAVAVADPRARRTETPIKLVFDVEDVEAVASAVGACGGVRDPFDSAWDFRGHRHLDCVDVEGNVVQLRQRLRE